MRRVAAVEARPAVVQQALFMRIAMAKRQTVRLRRQLKENISHHACNHKSPHQAQYSPPYITRNSDFLPLALDLIIVVLTLDPASKPPLSSISKQHVIGEAQSENDVFEEAPLNLHVCP